MKLHFDKIPELIIGKQAGRMSLCNMIWVRTTTDRTKVTCKSCLKKLKKIDDNNKQG